MLCIGVVTQWAEYLRQVSRMASAKTPSGGVARRNAWPSKRSLDGLEQVTPSAAKGAPQIDQDAEGGSDAASFQFLVMPAAEVHLLGNLLLSQTGGFTQSSEIATKSKEVGLCKRFQAETVPESASGKHVTAWRVLSAGRREAVGHHSRECRSPQISERIRARGFRECSSRYAAANSHHRESERPARGSRSGRLKAATRAEAGSGRRREAGRSVSHQDGRLG